MKAWDGGLRRRRRPGRPATPAEDSRAHAENGPFAELRKAGIDVPGPDDVREPAQGDHRGAAGDRALEGGRDHDDHDHGHDTVDHDHAEHGQDAPDHGRDHDHAHAHPHEHPHRAGADEHPLIGIVGAGAVGTALGVALTRAGWPIAAVASRDPARRERFVRLVGGAPRAFAEANAVLDEVELIFLTVPDDAIAEVAGQLRLYGGQALVHTSGLLGAEVLMPALAAGTQIGSFHPLVAFADTERAVAALHGATVAIEGDDRLVGLLGDVAEAIGAVPVRLAPGTKAAYHAAAVLAAGGFVALLDAIVELGRVAGLDETGALTVYAPLILQTLGNARVLGVRAALTGPMTRGDVGTLDAHLAELRRHAPAVLPLYVAAAEREIALAEARGALAPEAAARLRASLAKPA